MLSDRVLMKVQVIVVDPHPFVFKQVHSMIDELCATSKYDKTIVVLGYNVIDCREAEKIKKEHPGFKLVVYNMEQLYKGSPWLNRNSLSWFNVADEIWDYNMENISFFADELGYNVKYHPIKWVSCLRTLPRISPAGMLYDVLFYGEETPRRNKLIGAMRAAHRDWAVVTATGVTGEALDFLLAHSKIIINVHAFPEYRCQEIVRMFYPLINGKCVVSEPSRNDCYAGDSVVYSSYDTIIETVNGLLEHDKWIDVASEASDKFRRHTTKG